MSWSFAAVIPPPLSICVRTISRLRRNISTASSGTSPKSHSDLSTQSSQYARVRPRKSSGPRDTTARLIAAAASKSVPAASQE